VKAWHSGTETYTYRTFWSDSAASVLLFCTFLRRSFHSRSICYLNLMFFWPCIIVQTFLNYQLNAQFLYSSIICMLHYDPQHVSSSTLLIFRRTNCIITASGIVTLSKQPYSMSVESWLHSALNQHTVRLFTEGGDTRGCNNTVCPPEDEQDTARNMLRIVV